MATPTGTELTEWALITLWKTRKLFGDYRLKPELMDLLVLTCIRRGIISPINIIRFLEISQTTLLSIRKRLLKKGFTDEAQSATDPRGVVLSLTPDGAAYLGASQQTPGSSLIRQFNRKGPDALERGKAAIRVLDELLLRP